MRALIVSFTTYNSSHNDAKLAELGRRIENVTAVAGDLPTMWRQVSPSRSGDGYCVHMLDLRFRQSYATMRLVHLEEVAREARPAIMHIECEPWQGVAVQAVTLARKLDVPVGIQFAENGPLLEGAGGAVRRFVGRRVLERCCYAIGWSRESTAVARGLSPKLRLETRPGTGVTLTPDSKAISGTAEQWFGPGADRCAKIAFVGRFSPEKGLDDFLWIADRLAERFAVRVAIAGGPASHPTVRTWLSSRPWACAHGVLERPEVARLLAAADVLVSPSRTTRYAKEQFGKVPAEAMAVGTPVFAFDCGALGEVIGDGGVVVPEGAREILATELDRYFNAPEGARIELSKRALAQATNFTDAALADGLVRLWSELLNDVASRVPEGRKPNPLVV